MATRMVTVTVLSNYLKNILDAETLLYNIDVVGEVSGWSLSGANAFFTIKDSGAILNCVLFGANNFIKPKIGDKVIVTGSPKYYVKGGKLNFNVSNIKLFGEGEIYKRFIELKNRLQKEGLFDVDHKKPMPEKIDRIGVVTSETGAVIHDILNVAGRRNAGQDIVLFPIKVQGIGADVEIARAINFFSNYDGVDAIIVGRGGGSEEDLQNFNSEIVARAIYNCNKFVVSAVGHEVDTTICDYVADLRAPTPSAAAELLTKDGLERKQKLQMLIKNICDLTKNKITLNETILQNLLKNINSEAQHFIGEKTQQLGLLSSRLANANPTKILSMGYAKIEKGNLPVSSKTALATNDDISIIFADGTIQARVKWW